MLWLDGDADLRSVGRVVEPDVADRSSADFNHEQRLPARQASREPPLMRVPRDGARRDRGRADGRIVGDLPDSPDVVTSGRPERHALHVIGDADTAEAHPRSTPALSHLAPNGRMEQLGYGGGHRPGLEGGQRAEVAGRPRSRHHLRLLTLVVGHGYEQRRKAHRAAFPCHPAAGANRQVRRQHQGRHIRGIEVNMDPIVSRQARIACGHPQENIDLGLGGGCSNLIDHAARRPSRVGPSQGDQDAADGIEGSRRSRPASRQEFQPCQCEGRSE